MVWVDPASWHAALDARTDLPFTPMLDIWAESGWPLVARRAACCDRADCVPLGLPLPPHHGRHRLRFAMPAETIIRSAPPPLLAEAASCAPARWRDTIASLLGIDASVRCFGSLAWQYLTGLPYVTATSDLDLLWHPAADAEASSLARQISTLDAQAPMQIDGEFIAPSGRAVQWREWHLSAASELVVKAADEVRIIARGRLFA